MLHLCNKIKLVSRVLGRRPYLLPLWKSGPCLSAESCEVEVFTRAGMLVPAWFMTVSMRVIEPSNSLEIIYLWF